MSMTKEERDQKTHDTIMLLEPLVRANNKAIYGNGRAGLLDRMTRIESIAALVSAGGLLIAVIALLAKL